MCSNNKIESLKFSPREVGGECYYTNNKITNFDGLPEFFESDIDLFGNPINEVYRLFNEPGSVFGNPKCIYYIREFDVIRGNKVIKDRLDEVYVHVGMEIPKKIKFKSYTIV